MKNELNPVERLYFAFYNSGKKAMYFNEIREKAKKTLDRMLAVTGEKKGVAMAGY